MNIYDFTAKTISGKEISLRDYQGKVLLIVNTASKCGFTPQYKELQTIYEKYQQQGLEILGFPSNQFAAQEPDDNTDIQSFCQLNYGVTFPLFAKGDVRGENAHPLFNYLTGTVPFTGFDLTDPMGAKINSVLQERFPELLPGDSIKWNFTKFLIDRTGKVIGRYEPPVTPLSLEAAIQKLL